MLRKKIVKKVVFENETYSFIIDEKDIALFENVKETCLDDIYFFIEDLEFLQIEFVMESDLEKEKENENNDW